MAPKPGNIAGLIRTRGTSGAHLTMGAGLQPYSEIACATRQMGLCAELPVRLYRLQISIMLDATSRAEQNTHLASGRIAA